MKKLTKAALLASAVVAAGAFMGCSSDVDSKDTTVETFKAKEIENLNITNVDNRALVIKWDVTESVDNLVLYKKVGNENWVKVADSVASPYVIRPTFADQFADKTEYKFKLVNKTVTENPTAPGADYTEHYVYKTESVAKEISYKFDLKKDESIPAYKTNLPSYADADVALWVNEDKTSYEISVPKSDIYDSEYEVYVAGTDVKLARGTTLNDNTAGTVSYTWALPFLASDVDVKVYKTFGGSSFYGKSAAVVKNIKFDNKKAASNLPAAVTTTAASVTKAGKSVAKITWEAWDYQTKKVEYVIYKAAVDYDNMVLGSFEALTLAPEVSYGTGTENDGKKADQFTAYDDAVEVNKRYMYVVLAKNSYGPTAGTSTPVAVTIRAKVTAGAVTNFAAFGDTEKKSDSHVAINENNFYLTWNGDTAATYTLTAYSLDKDREVVGTTDLTSLIKSDDKDHFSAYTKLSCLESKGVKYYDFVLIATDEDGKKKQYSDRGEVVNDGTATLDNARILDAEPAVDGGYKKITKLTIEGSNLKGKEVTVKARLSDGSWTSEKAECKDKDPVVVGKWDAKVSISGDKIQALVVQYEGKEVTVF